MATEMKNVRYVVVERAGYIGERDVATFDRHRLAWEYIAATYGDDERDPDSPEALLPDVRTDWTDDDGNEQSEYIS